MLSKGVLWVFVIEFVIGAVVACFERSWGMAIYFIGGAILNFGLIIK